MQTYRLKDETETEHQLDEDEGCPFCTYVYQYIDIDIEISHVECKETGEYRKVTTIIPGQVYTCEPKL